MTRKRCIFLRVSIKGRLKNQFTAWKDSILSLISWPNTRWYIFGAWVVHFGVPSAFMHIWVLYRCLFDRILNSLYQRCLVIIRVHVPKGLILSTLIRQVADLAILGALLALLGLIMHWYIFSASFGTSNMSFWFWL